MTIARPTPDLLRHVTHLRRRFNGTRLTEDVSVCAHDLNAVLEYFADITRFTPVVDQEVVTEPAVNPVPAIVDAVWDDICDRSGLDLRDLDWDIQAGIRETWAEAITSILNSEK